MPKNNLAFDFIRRLFFLVPKLPSEVQIEVTNRCNFTCKMCQRFSLGVPIADLSWDKYQQVIEALDGIKSLVLTGWGEPFLHPDIFRMIAAGKGKGWDVRLTSNGSFLTPDFRQRIIASGLDAITFSIDEAEAGESEWGHALKDQLANIAALARERREAGSKLKIFFQSTFHLDGEEKILKIVEKAGEIGADRVRVSRLDLRFDQSLRRPDLAAEKHLVRELMKAGKKSGVGVDFLPYLAFDGANQRAFRLLHPLLHRFGRFCLRTFDQAYVNQSLDLSPCCALPKLGLGNLAENSLAEIWQSESFQDFRRRQKKFCGKCDILSLRPYDFGKKDKD